MKKASEYYQRAQDSRQLAAHTDADHKATLLRMAKTWETLAHTQQIKNVEVVKDATHSGGATGFNMHNALPLAIAALITLVGIAYLLSG